NLPGKIEAENFDLGGEGLAYHDSEAANQGGAYRTTEGVDVQATTDTGAGYNVGYITAGEWLKYMVNATAAGNYDIAVRIATTAAGSTLHIELDGTNITGTINVPNTGAWQTWQTVTLKNIALTAGAKTMKVSMDAGSFNLNYITVQSSVVAVNQAPTVFLTAPANGASAISPATIAITASASDVDGTVSKVDFYNGTTLLGTATASPYAFTWSNVATGTYSITAKATDNSGASTTSAAASVTVTAPVVNDCPKLTWSDEFNGTSLDQSKWNYQTGDGCPGNCGWGNNELEYYTNTTSNVSVSGGSLALTARYQPNYNGSGKNYTSGKLVTSGKFSQKYGRYEARIKAPSAASIWPAFWMLADNTNWPATGEIDILECLNANPTLWYGTLHYASTSGVHQSKGATWTSPAPLSDDYHVYAVEWSTTQISWFIDGTLRGTATKADVISGGGAWPFDNQNFFIILNVAVGGDFPGQTPISSQFPVSMLVDYVRVYSGDPCTVTQAPYGGTAWPIPGTIEAENYDIGGEGVSFHDATSTNDAGAYRQDAVDIEASTDTGAGYDVGYTAAGEWLKYTVNVTASGNYDLAVRVAATAAGKSMHVEIDGVNVSGAIAVPNTGGWQTWQTVTIKNIPLIAGQRMLRIVMDTDGFNLNKVVFTPSSTTPPPTNLAPVVSLTAPANNASQNAPASITISATASDADGTVSKVDFYNGTTLLSSDATAPYSYTWTNVAAGTYNISAKATDNLGASTTSTAATVKVNTVVSSNTCSGIAQYVENGGYAAGSKVQSGGSQYQCKPYPYSGWCNGAAWAYGPGSGAYWTDAWTLVGTCSAARTESSAAVNDAMLSNAPNPFTGMTNVQVTVQQAGDVSLQVFDKTGQVVATIFEGYLSAGTYDYTLDATHLKADLYIVKFNSSNGVIARKIVKSE
ncbi:MAG: carbohydrate-binding protein, partial [Chitinophagaceae bacterium]|nr:carbohydrate-binding protein [Chitinophagaceae bacterium]